MPIIAEKNIEILFTEEEITKRVQHLAKEIAAQKIENLLVLPVLKGAFVFAADLIRALYKENVVLTVEFITISSYGSKKTSEKAHLLQDLLSDIKGRDILLVEDVLETGKTLAFTKKLLQEKGAKRVMTAIFLDKPFGRVAHLNPDFIGFSCPNKFVVGYGMDCCHNFRQLPFIGALED